MSGLYYRCQAVVKSRRRPNVIIGRNLAVLLSAGLIAQAQLAPRIKPPKKEKEPETQTLPLPPEPPAAVIVETGKLAFHVSPLSAKGLLTQQVHDALKALDRANNGGTFVKLRAFVAGTGDMRRVAAIVSEEFSDRKIPLPAVTTIQVGALPMEGAQVVIESISAEKKPVNPNGLAFFSAQRAVGSSQVVAQLAQAAKTEQAVMLQVTCFLPDFTKLDSARASVTSAFPGASANFVQLTRLAVEPQTSCEGLGRLTHPPRSPVEFLAGSGVAVNHPKLIFTDAQIAFTASGARDEDLRLAYGRLGRALESVQGSYSRSVVMNIYALNPAVADQAAALAPEFLGSAARPAGATQVVEGLPSLDATVAIELVALGP
jgi:enamine deaminase RidA (YjgF/YER057c/UK114 family)